MARGIRAFEQLPRLSAVIVLALVSAGVCVTPAGADDSAGLTLSGAASQPVLVDQTHAVNSTSARKVRAPHRSVAPTCGTVTFGPGASPGGYIPLSVFAIPPIAGIGDDTSTAFNVPSFTYNGTSYTQLSVGSNGYLQVGSTSNVSLVNQAFPDPSVPNNVLAPFWTDLNPASAGQIRIGTLNDGTDTWIVVDYNAVREFSVSGNLHSFEVWIGINTDPHPGQDITYAYDANNGNGDLGFLTVGAENDAGTSGAYSYYNGAGTLPTSGTQLRVSNSSPTASFTAAPTSGKAPLSVGFDASASVDDNGISKYHWTFGDGSGANGVTKTHKYKVGVYTARLTVTDINLQKCSATETIYANGGFSVDDVSVNEADGTATFTVSRPNGGPASVDVGVTSGTAVTPADFEATPATLAFPTGVTSQTYSVTIKQDTIDEPNQTYNVVLSNPVDASLKDATGKGTIVDDDPPVRVSVNDANLTEGDSGTTNLMFRVSLNKASEKTVKVTLHTADGSATAPTDFVNKTIVLTFKPGQTLKKVPIAIKGDLVTEPDEAFFVLLTAPVSSVLKDPNGTGGIINDD